jgi:hypothetical protein
MVVGDFDGFTFYAITVTSIFDSLTVGTPVVFATVTVAVMCCPDAQTAVNEVTCGSGRGAGCVAGCAAAGGGGLEIVGDGRLPLDAAGL